MDTRLSGFDGVGAVREKALAGAGVVTAGDLLRRFPKGYKDLTRVTPIAGLRAGMVVYIRGTVVSAKLIRAGTSRVIAQVTDASGGRVACVWFNQPYMLQRMRTGETLSLYGRVEIRKGLLQLVCPSVEPPDAVGRLRPVYAEIPGVPGKTLENIVAQALDAVGGAWPETLPQALRERYALMSAPDALSGAHRPPDSKTMEEAARRWAFEELVLFQCALEAVKSVRPEGVVIPVTRGELDDAETALPYRLTGAQSRALDAILGDLASPRAMARLLQGDVGSGKTVVALLALLAAVRAGYQGALMAPTEILAGQHLQAARRLLEPLGVRVGLLTGSVGARERKAAYAAISAGEWDVVVGTHALITDKLAYRDLGLVVIDEQHRFGVRQREALLEKRAVGKGANVLALSATPIPRSLALVLYADLDLTVIDELPPGRTPVKTHLVAESKRAGMLGFIDAQVEDGRQAYVVCPMIEESEAFDAACAKETAEEVARALPGRRVALLHGKQRAADKDALIAAFRNREIDILVSTTVIEVGVDVPNASVMVIEDAKRFGLSQLHQLRGRVGRGAAESFCFLMADADPDLRFFASTNDGFAIAQRDLEDRGPGEMMGTRQHGAPSRQLISLVSDVRLLDQTRDASEWLRRDHARAWEDMAVYAAIRYPELHIAKH